MLLVPVVLALAACGGSEGGDQHTQRPDRNGSRHRRGRAGRSDGGAHASPVSDADNRASADCCHEQSGPDRHRGAGPYRHGTSGGLCYGHA